MIRVWTPKYPNGCRTCRTKTRLHHGQGYCTKCYRIKQTRGLISRSTNSALRRERAGKLQFFCYVCSEWKPGEQFTADHKRRTVCHDCHLALRRERYAERRDKLNEARRLQYAADMEAVRLADKKHKRRGDPWARKLVPRETVQAWLDVAFALHDDSISQVAVAMGYSEKNVRRIRAEPRGVTIDVAENLATVAGKTDELRDLLQPGVEGWSTAGHRFCQRCGRYDVPHSARGYCRRCYCVVWWHEKKGQEPTLPRDERWSMRHTACVICGRSKHKHQGHGICTGCYQQWRRMTGRC